MGQGVGDDGVIFGFCECQRCGKDVCCVVGQFAKTTCGNCWETAHIEDEPQGEDDPFKDP